MKCKRLVPLLVFSIFLVGSLLITIPNAAAQGNVIHWKLQATYPMGDLATFHALKWAKVMDTMTGGRLKVQVMPPGAIVGPADIIPYLKKNVFQVAVAAGPFYTGLIPEGDLEVGLPMSYLSYDEVWDAMENRGLGKLIREAYAEHNIEWFYCAGEPLYNFITTFPVRTMADYKGKKLRAVGSWGDFVKAMGGAPVVIPGGEVYMALKLKTIDGAIYGSGSMDVNKMHEVVDYYVTPSMLQVTICLIINKDALAALPADIQAIVRNSTQYILHDTSMHYIRSAKDSYLKRIKDGSIKEARMPEKEVEKMRKLAAPIWAKVAVKSPRMKKGVEIIKQHMRDVGRPID